ncbi:MAG: SCO family protein [Gemmatimonadota bacterium]
MPAKTDSMRRHALLLPVVLGLLGVSLAACGGERGAGALPDAADLPLKGNKSITPIPKVDLVMPDTRGELYDFRERTRGKVALLFFGYTYCPDVCPIHMATLASALKELEPTVREKIRTVFVTVDPERDTPDRLRDWLATFDSSFVGLRGTPEEINRALAFYRSPPPERSQEGDGYTVGHPAFIYAFTPDGWGRALYGPETTKAIWIHDLQLLAAVPASEPKPSAAPEGPTESAQAPEGEAPSADSTLGRAGDVVVRGAVIPEPAPGSGAALYLTLVNTGAAADSLVALSTPAAERVTLHDMVMREGVMRMIPMGPLPVPPGRTVRLAPGSRHAMLEGVRPGTLQAGGEVEATLIFARGGAVRIRVPVVRYEDVTR